MREKKSRFYTIYIFSGLIFFCVYITILFRSWSICVRIVSTHVSQAKIKSLSHSDMLDFEKLAVVSLFVWYYEIAFFFPFNPISRVKIDLLCFAWFIFSFFFICWNSYTCFIFKSIVSQSICIAFEIFFFEL